VLKRQSRFAFAAIRHSKKERVLRIRTLSIFLFLIVLVGLNSARPAVADSPTSGDWANWGYDLANHRYNPNESLITPANVSQLKPIWEFVFPGTEIASVPPTIIDGTVYVGSWNGDVYAIDAATGKTRWTFATALTGRKSAVRVAILVSGNLVLFGDQLGRFFALNKTDGSLVWLQQEMEKHPLAQITGSPILYQDRIYIPMSSREEAAGISPTYQCCTFRGGLIALNIADGSVAWHFYTVDEPKPTQKNKVGTQNYGPSGVSLWTTPAIDPDEGLIYLSTGNSYTEPNSPYSDAILALNLQDGTVRWVKQLTDGDWYNTGCDQLPPQNCEANHGKDVDFSGPPMLWTIKTPNGTRKLVGAAQKNGMFHALDALTGEVVWQQTIGQDVSFVWGTSYDGAHVYIGDGTFLKDGAIYALDPVTGAIAWHSGPFPCVPGKGQSWGTCWAGFMNATTTPGLLWMGSMDGQLRALDSETGSVLWTFNTSIAGTDANGTIGHGGSIGPGGVVVANGQVYANSGYQPWGPRFQTGNLLIAFGLESADF
jgi:polyvinyl alcohol dehydrogenase (cytochrome)